MNVVERRVAMRVGCVVLGNWKGENVDARLSFIFVIREQRNRKREKETEKKDEAERGRKKRKKSKKRGMVREIGTGKRGRE